MKLLFLTPRVPYPPYRGDKLKVWNLLRQLSKRHRITLLTFVQNKEEEGLLEPVREFCEEIHFVRLPKWRSVVNCFFALWKKIPFQVAYYESKKMAALVGETIKRTKPDIIHTHPIRMAQYTVGVTSIPKVLDSTDAKSLYLARFRETQKNLVLKWLLGMELKRMIAYEAIIAKYDRVLTCSYVDRDFLLKRAPNASIELLYNGIDLETFSRNGDEHPDPYRIIFTGNMTYFPNIYGAEFLVKEIFPLIKEAVPQAVLYIVGQNPPSRVKSLASKDVIVTGFVEDLKTEYLKSSVAVSPILFGSGTLNKVLEPLALGIPVVSTSYCVEGLELKEDEEILIANDPKEFADSVVRLLQDPSLRARMANAAMQKVRSRFGWSEIVAGLDRLYTDIQRKPIAK